MIGNWFKRKPTECTDKDVRFLFLLCFGRAPIDGDEMAPYLGTSFFTSLKNLLGRQEFKSLVLGRISLAKQPPHASLDDGALRDLAAGITAHFHTEKPTEPHTWRGLLSVAADSPRFGRAFLHHFSDDRLATLKHGLATLQSMPAADIVGTLVGTNGYLLTGRALNRLAPDSAVLIDFYLNGLYAGTARADLPEDQFAEDFEGHAPFGFSHQLEIPPALKSQDRVSLSAFEKTSGAPVFGPRELVLDATLGNNVMQHLLAELRMLRDHSPGQDVVLATLDKIESQLPKLHQYSSFPLDQYHLFQETFPLAPPQWLARCDVRFDIVVYDSGDKDALRATLASIKHQSFPALSIKTVGNMGQETPAVAYARAIPSAEGTHLLFLKAGDKLALHALAWIASSIENKPNAHVFFCDYDHYRAGQQRRFDPCFQQQFDYDLLLQHNGLGRAFAVEREQLLELGAFDENTSTAFHQYILLRHYEMFGDGAFLHIPHVLWHVEPDEPGPKQLLTQRQDQIRVCESHFSRRGIKVKAEPHHDPYGGAIVGILRLNWPIDETLPKLGIIIPTRDRLDLIRPCVEGLLATLEHPDQTDVVILDNGSSAPALLKWFQDIQNVPQVSVVRSETEFNWSALNNLGAASTDASYLLFLNDDTLAQDKGWDTVLRSHLARDSVGALGARLLYRNGTIQHAGMVFYSLEDARHEGNGAACEAPHPLNRTRLAHSCSAVTGAFMACRRDTFEAIGGFDEALAITYNDADFCFKVRRKGMKVLFEPQITFQHFQSESRGRDSVDEHRTARAKKEATVFAERWQAYFQGDIYYPRAFARLGTPFSRLAPPAVDSL